MNSRGYFGIGIAGGKCAMNVGTLWRSAYQLGASFIFTAGARYQRQSSDTYKTERHIPFYEYEDVEQFLASRPFDCRLVGVEFGGKDIVEFTHPERAIYVLGAEDRGLPKEIVARCQHLITLPHVRVQSYNVAVAGSLVMYDRIVKASALAKQRVTLVSKTGTGGD